MAVSDRDKKVIYTLLIIMVIFLPYFFYIKNCKAETQAINLENEALQKRYEELKAMNEKREEYQNETADMKRERDAIINTFPGGIAPANYTLFLLEAQTRGRYEIDEETGRTIYPELVWFKSVNYGETIDTAISSEEADTGFTGLTNISILQYETFYRGLKYMLSYLMTYQDPMSYKHVTITFDEKLGQISGEILLAQYAITGPDRPELQTPDFFIVKNDVFDNVSVDYLELRGNTDVEKNGIFGPIEAYVPSEDDEDDYDFDGDPFEFGDDITE